MFVYLSIYFIECFPCLSLFLNKKLGQKVKKASRASAVRWFCFLFFSQHFYKTVLHEPFLEQY